jgi:hypothetical protein
LQAQRRAAGHTAGAIYVCGDRDGVGRVTRVGGPEWRGVQVRRLDELQQRVIAIGEQRRGTRGPTVGARTQSTTGGSRLTA